MEELFPKFGMIIGIYFVVELLFVPFHRKKEPKKETAWGDVPSKSGGSRLSSRSNSFLSPRLKSDNAVEVVQLTDLAEEDF